MCDKVEIRYEWTCPDCGHRNSNLATVRDRHGSLSAALVYCDIEDGGCDRMVAVKPRLLVQTDVYRVVNPTDNQMDDAILDAQASADDADESMANHRDNINRAREQMDGLRRGMGLVE